MKKIDHSQKGGGTFDLIRRDPQHGEEKGQKGKKGEETGGGVSMKRPLPFGCVVSLRNEKKRFPVSGGGGVFFLLKQIFFSPGGGDRLGYDGY